MKSREPPREPEGVSAETAELLAPLAQALTGPDPDHRHAAARAVAETALPVVRNHIIDDLVRRLTAGGAAARAGAAAGLLALGPAEAKHWTAEGGEQPGRSPTEGEETDGDLWANSRH